MVLKLDALIDDSKSSHRRVLRVRFSECLPMPCIEAPVTEFDINILKNLEARPTWEHNTSSLFSNFRAAKLEGFHSLALGTALEDPLIDVYLAGWDSVEVRVSVAYVLKTSACIDDRMTWRHRTT